MGQVKNNDSFLGKAEKLKPVLKHRMLRPVGVVSFERKKADSVVSALETAVRKGRAVEYVKGFSSERDEMTEEDLKQACEAAAGADVVVIFAGLPDSFESEGYDRNSMELPKCQNRLIEAVAEIQKNVVVVLHNGSPVETPWAESVNAILEMYLGGEGIGEASDRLLFGEANPGGRLAETFPYRLEDNPSYLNFPGDGRTVLYGEDIFVGYRYYDA
ncbi:glycoside hydrolase family 3 protein, partial [Mediterraneibacter gnavus]